MSLYSNLASLAESHADVEIEKAAKQGNKFHYQANRAFIIGRLKGILVPILCSHEPDTEHLCPGRPDGKSR